MKFLIFCTVICQGLIIIYGTNSNNMTLANFRNTLDDKLKIFLETKLRNIITEGYEQMNIPVLDPLTMVNVNLKLETEEIQFVGELLELHCFELSKYNVTKAKMGILSKNIVVGLDFPKIIIKGQHRFVSHFFTNLRINGEGTFDALVSDLSLNIDIKFSVEQSNITIQSLNIKISLSGLEFAVSGIIDDQISYYVGKVISTITPEILEEYHDNITNYIAEEMIILANQKLEGQKLQDILELIN